MRGARFAALHRTLPALGLAICLVAGGPARAEPAAHEAEEAAIDTIVVTSSRIDKRSLAVPAAVTVVSEREIQRARQQLSLGEALAGVPGVFTQNRGNTTLGMVSIAFGKLVLHQNQHPTATSSTKCCPQPSNTAADNQAIGI